MGSPSVISLEDKGLAEGSHESRPVTNHLDPNSETPSSRSL